MRSLQRFYTILVLVGLAVALPLLAFATPIVGTRADFSAFNAGWNGGSTLVRSIHGSGAYNPLFAPVDTESGLELRPASLDTYPLSPANDAVLIVGPRAAYTVAEIAHLRTFLHAGGTLFLADDFGMGNSILEGVGAQARIEEGRALDFAFVKRPEFTIAIELEDHEITDGVERVLLNYPAAIRAGERTRVLATTTEAAWLDTDGDSERDSAEAGGPFPWLAVEPVGNGTLVLLSDPSVLINGMRSFSDNARLADNVVLFLTDRPGAVVVDEAHRDAADPLAFLGLRVRGLPLVARIAILAAAAGIVALVATGTFRRALDAPRALLSRLLSAPEELSARESLLARTKARHPDWDETALREILDGWGVEDGR